MSLAGVEEQDRFAAAARAAGAADAMHVAFAIEREIVVDHVADALHVEPAGGDVGGDDDVELARAEVVDDPFALLLRDVAAQRGDAMPLARQELGEVLGRALRLHEDDHAVDRFGFQHACSAACFCGGGDDEVTLTNRLGGRRSFLNRDLGRVAQMLLRDAANCVGHRRREQRDLSLRRRLREHPFDVFGKTHSQHFVGFVEHEALQPVELQRTATHVIHHAARRADDDMHAAIEFAELHVIILTAVDGDDAQARHGRGITFERFGDLNRQFARRRRAPALAGRLASRSMRCNSGSAKAAVLPVPVCAWPSTSRPSSSSGIARA